MQAPAPPPSAALERALLLGLCLLALSVLIPAPLHEPDEGRYAEIGWAMLHSGDWLTPHLSGLPYFEKPPLYFWTLALSFACFGVHEVSARLPSLLAFLLTLALVRAWGRRLGEARGSVAALILLSTPLSLFFSRFVLVDTTLGLWITGALYAAGRGLVTPTPEAPSRPWILAHWACVGAAFLTKGPIGLALACLGPGLFLLARRSWRGLWAWLRPDGPALALALAGPWFLLMAQAHPSYLSDFFLRQNLARATAGGEFGRQASLLYYLPVLLAGAAPWSVLLPGLLARTWHERGCPRDPEFLYVHACLWPALGLLSVAGSKLAYYLLPLLPLLALLLAHELLRKPWSERAQARLARAWQGGALLLALVGLAAALLALPSAELLQARFGRAEAPELIRREALRVRAIQAGLPLVAPLLLGGAALAWAAGSSFRQARWQRGWGALGALSLSLLLATPALLARSGGAFSSRALAAAAHAHAGSEGPVIAYGTFPRGVAFYLRRPLFLWSASFAEFGTELARGAEPHALQCELWRLEALLDDPRALVIAKDDAAAAWLSEHLRVPLRELQRCGERVLLVPAARGAKSR